MSIEQYFTEVLICISVVTNDVGQILCVYWLNTYIYIHTHIFFCKSLIKCFSHLRYIYLFTFYILFIKLHLNI